MSETVDIIFFGAHPDDVELAAGATAAKCVMDGLRVGIVDLTSGEMGTRGTAATRRREAQAAAKALGAAFRRQLDFGDGGLRHGRDEELQIIDVLRTHRPRVIVAPWLDDRHPDHMRAGRLITDASFYAGLRALDTGKPAHRPQAVVYYFQHYVEDDPSFIVDVSKSWKRKMKAVYAFKSQFHDPKSKEPQTVLSDPKFLAGIEGRARHYGNMIGAEFGEAFMTKQPPRVDDLLAAYGGREV
jgi:bacillithiol biosynthesis deacetylase BshB1